LLRCIETLFQKKAGYLSIRSAGDEITELPIHADFFKFKVKAADDPSRWSGELPGLPPTPVKHRVAAPYPGECQVEAALTSNQPAFDGI
jgi:hypothetical protein